MCDILACDILIELILLGYKYVMVCGNIGGIDINVDIFREEAWIGYHDLHP